MSGVSVITGGGSGLGAAIAKRLNFRSQPIIICGRRLNKLLETKEACANPSLVRIVEADISKPEGRGAILRALGEGEKVQHLIHNAAVLEPFGTLASLEPDQWRKHMEINLDGPLFLTQTLLPRLRPNNKDEERGGRVLHISSGAAHYPYRGWLAYCTSKAAFHMMYKSLSTELSHIGVAVGSARPGVIDTPMQDLIRSQSEEMFPDVTRFKVMKDQGRLMNADDIAVFIDWVLNETNDVEFSEKEWDVRDESTRVRWEAYM